MRKSLRFIFTMFLMLVSVCMLVSCGEETNLVTSVAITGNVKMDLEGEQNLTVTVLPETAVDKTVSWSSSDPTIVKVTNGKVEALKVGSATITATANDGSGKKGEITIVVEEPVGTNVSSVSVIGLSIMIINTNQELQTKVLPKTALNKACNWSSSDESVLSVDETGKVTALKLGKATIYATSEENAEIKGQIEITVMDVTEPVSVPNLMGQKFIIMANRSSTSDPRNADYIGNWKDEKVKLISDAETKYNVKIEYQTYPAEAVWGGGRERWITENTINKTTTVHIYEMPSYSIAVLAEANAILALDDLIEEFGNEGYWPEKAAFGKVLDKQYSYDDDFPLVGQGIFYNATLIGNILGEEYKYKPSQLWLDGEWTWEAFDEMCNELLPGVTTLGIENSGVIGGRPYNWAYQMLGANGVHVVSSDLKSELATESGIDTLTFLSELCNTPGMWEYESSRLDNASCPQFKLGNIVFHNGEPYWMYDSTKWDGYDFEMGFVPYPKGPNAEEDLSNYCINEVYGKTTYLVSALFSKDNIQPGYESIAFYDETIFRIWADLQYFPEIDPETGYADIKPIIEEWSFNTLELYYGDNVCLDAHKSIMTKGYPDYFYSLYYARSQSFDKSFMLEIQTAIISGEIRSQMEDLVSRIHQEFVTTYKNIGLTADYYA